MSERDDCVMTGEVEHQCPEFNAQAIENERCGIARKICPFDGDEQACSEAADAA